MARKRDWSEPAPQPAPAPTEGETMPAGTTPTYLLVEVRGPDGPGARLALENASLPDTRPLHLDIPGVEGEVLLTQPRWHLTEKRWQARALVRVSGPIDATVAALKAAGFVEVK